MSQPSPAVKRRPGFLKIGHLLILIVVTILFASFIVPAVKVSDGDHFTEEITATHFVALESNTLFRQGINYHLPYRYLKELNIRFGTYGRANKGTLEVKLYENDNEVCSWTLPTEEIKDNELQSFPLDKPILMRNGVEYFFTILDNYRGRNMLSVALNRINGLGYQVGNNKTDRGTLCYTIRFKNPLPPANVTCTIGYILMVVVLLLAFFIHAHWDGLSAHVNSVFQQFPGIRLKNTDVTMLDWIVFAALAILCFFTMQHSDILHTGASSFALLRGHLLDFYEYNAQYLGGNAYMISTYIMFAIWNIPLAVLGLMGPPSMTQTYATLMWFKALPTTLFVASGILIYQICKKLEKPTGINAKWGTFLFLSTSTAFYSQFMFGQYDVLTVFFMVLALKVLFDEKKNYLVCFSFLFGIATTFKYHALLFFFPILLYREKRLGALIKNVFFYGLPVILINLPYIHSSFFTSGVQGFGAVDYFFAASVDYYVGNIWRIYIVPLLWIIMCTAAYVRPTAESLYDRFRAIAFYSGLLVWLAFGMVFWHPQWPMIATPFLILAFYASKRRNVLCLLDIGLTIAFMSFVESLFTGLTQGFFRLGLFGSQVAGRQLLSAITFDKFCLLKDSNVAFTTFSGILLARALLIRPESDIAQRPISPQLETLWFRIRGYGGILLLTIPMILCLITELHTPSFFSDIHIDEEHGNATVVVNTEYDFNNLFAAVWSEENDQDDLVWYTMEHLDGKEWQCEIPLEDHNALGTYYVHIYQFHEGKPRRIMMMDFEISSLPTIAQDSAEDSTQAIMPQAS